MTVKPASPQAPNEVDAIHSGLEVNYYVRNNSPAAGQRWAFYKSGTNNSALYLHSALSGGSYGVLCSANVWFVHTTATWLNFAEFGLGSYLLKVSNLGKNVGGDSFVVK